MCLLKNKGSKRNYSICSDKLTKADKEIENYCRRSGNLKNKSYFVAKCT